MAADAAPNGGAERAIHPERSALFAPLLPKGRCCR